MKRRKLINGAMVPTEALPYVMKIMTKCPCKWLLIDCETGGVWGRNPEVMGWIEPPKPVLKAGRLAIARVLKKGD